MSAPVRTACSCACGCQCPIRVPCLKITPSFGEMFAVAGREAALRSLPLQSPSRVPRGALRMRFGLLALLLTATTGGAMAASGYGDCEVSGARGSVKLETVVPGALSVRPTLPAPGWWNGDSPDTIKDGFEYCLAANIAYRAGLDRVLIVNRSFAQILTG